MFITGVLIGFLLITIGIFWGIFDKLRILQVSRIISLAMSGFVLILALRSIIHVLHENRKDHIKLHKKIKFAISVLPTSLVWVCEEVASIHERITPMQQSYTVQYKTLFNKRNTISQIIENDVKQKYQYA